MLDRIRSYFYERRRGMATTAGVVGTLYMTGKYVMDRLEEMREQTIEMQRARENLRRRFQQNQEDVVFTTMTRLPILSKAIMEGMDVESVTSELQRASKSKRGGGTSSNLFSSGSSVTSSGEVTRESTLHDERSEILSTAGTEASMLDVSSGLGDSILSLPSETSQAPSWVDEFSSQMASSSGSDVLAMPSSSHQHSDSTHGSPRSNTGAYMSDSLLSESAASTSASERDHSRAGQYESAAVPKTKTQLWNEIKILTFTRTLTIIYSTTLLTLLTTVQLNIIGRSKYLQSIIQLCREEKHRERRIFQASVSSLFFGGLPDLDEDLDADFQDVSLVLEDTERRFLTLSWWLLYVGWKDVGERVRRSVEEVFEGVSLKQKLGPMELHRLLSDVRRRVEHEVTYEGVERRINFLSTIIPPTPETLNLALGGGNTPPGYSVGDFLSPPSRARDQETDVHLSRLLEEMRETVSTPAYVHVLEKSLDRATEILLAGLNRNVFVGDAASGLGEEAEKVRLAGLMPGLARWGHLALDTVPNELVDGVVDLKEMTAFAAIIYSNYDNYLQSQ